MLSWLDPDPTKALIDAVSVVVAVLLAVWLAPRRVRRVRSYGGQRRAVVVTVVGALCLSACLLPGLIGENASLMLFVIGLGITFQPEAIVRLTGGPSPAWSALKAGTELLGLLDDRPDRDVALRDPGVVEALAALEAARTTATDAYVNAAVAVASAAPDGPGAGERQDRLATAEAELGRSLGERPSFQRRAARQRPGS